MQRVEENQYIPFLLKSNIQGHIHNVNMSSILFCCNILVIYNEALLNKFNEHFTSPIYVYEMGIRYNITDGHFKVFKKRENAQIIPVPNLCFLR